MSICTERLDVDDILSRVIEILHDTLDSDQDIPTEFEIGLMRHMWQQLNLEIICRLYHSTSPRHLELDQDWGSNSIWTHSDAMERHLGNNFPQLVLEGETRTAFEWAVHLWANCGWRMETAMLCALDRNNALQQANEQVRMARAAESSLLRRIRRLRPQRPRVLEPVTRERSEGRDRSDEGSSVNHSLPVEPIAVSSAMTLPPNRHRGESDRPTRRPRLRTRSLRRRIRSLSADSYFPGSPLRPPKLSTTSPRRRDRSSSPDRIPGSPGSKQQEDKNTFGWLHQELQVFIHSLRGTQRVDKYPYPRIESPKSHRTMRFPYELREGKPGFRIPDTFTTQPKWSEAHGPDYGFGHIWDVAICALSHTCWSTGFPMRVLAVLRHIAAPVDPYLISPSAIRGLQASYLECLCYAYMPFDRPPPPDTVPSCYYLHSSHIRILDESIPGSRALTSSGRKTLVDFAHKHTRAKANEAGDLDFIDWSSGWGKELLQRSDQCISFAKIHHCDPDTAIDAGTINRLIALLHEAGSVGRGQEVVFTFSKTKAREFLRLLGR